MFAMTVSVIVLLVIALFRYVLGVSMLPNSRLVYYHMLTNILLTQFVLTVSLVLITLMILQVRVLRVTSAVKTMRVKTCCFTQLGKVSKVFIISSAMPCSLMTL